MDYVKANSSTWSTQPEVISDGLQDGFMLVFGKPRTAVFAHLDTVGFTVSYDNRLVEIGSPAVEETMQLQWHDGMQLQQTTALVVNEKLLLGEDSLLPLGTPMSYAPQFESQEMAGKVYVSTPYLDNRGGVLNALRLARTLANGVICFSTHEEHGGGSVSTMCRILHERWGIRQALISDLTWETPGGKHVRLGQGPAISLRDVNVPRYLFLKRIQELAAASGQQFQLEVEEDGSSDGREVSRSPYPMDWCFIGAPIRNMHSPQETACWQDLEGMLVLYQYLMTNL